MVGLGLVSVGSWSRGGWVCNVRLHHISAEPSETVGMVVEGEWLEGERVRQTVSSEAVEDVIMYRREDCRVVDG